MLMLCRILTKVTMNLESEKRYICSLFFAGLVLHSPRVSRWNDSQVARNLTRLRFLPASSKAVFQRECYFPSAWTDSQSHRWLFSVHVLGLLGTPNAGLQERAFCRLWHFFQISVGRNLAQCKAEFIELGFAPTCVKSWRNCGILHVGLCRVTRVTRVLDSKLGVE